MKKLLLILFLLGLVGGNSVVFAQSPNIHQPIAAVVEESSDEDLEDSCD